jgi:hypothetical protein
MTGVLVASAAQYAIKKKLRAQALCVNSAANLQQELSKTLSKLMRLNPRATQLRAQRASADRAYFTALASANPYAIAATRAIRTGVILAQRALQAEQQRLLASSRLQRMQARQKLYADSRSLTQSAVRAQTYFVRGLAVDPVPSTSPTPDYLTTSQFSRHQQHLFEFEVDLSPKFWKQRFIQTTTCSVSLNGTEGAWNPQVVAASAPSKRL